MIALLLRIFEIDSIHLMFLSLHNSILFITLTELGFIHLAWQSSYNFDELFNLTKPLHMSSGQNLHIV